MTNNKPVKRITVKDIAKIAGVSATAVSMALNNRGSLTQELRDDIKRIANELGYIPNVGARALRGSSTQSFGVVINYFNNPFFHDFFIGLEDVINSQGFSYWASQTWDQLEQEQLQINKLVQLGVDGLILLPCMAQAPHLKEISNKFATPLVLINHFVDTAFPAVVVDNVHGGFLATEHLLLQSDRPVIHIAGPIDDKTGLKGRYDGFRRAINQYRPALDADQYVFYVKQLIAQSGYQIMSSVLARFKPPISLFIVNDEVALGIINYCHNHQLRIPQDVAMVGFSDIDILSSLNIPLSSIAVPRREMGQHAARLLLDNIKGQCSQDHIVSLPVSLIIRDSSRII